MTRYEDGYIHVRVRKDEPSSWPLAVAGVCIVIAGLVWWQWDTTKPTKPDDPTGQAPAAPGSGPVVVIHDPRQPGSDPPPVEPPDPPLLPFEFSTDEALACRKALLNAMWPMFDGKEGSIGQHGDELYEWTHKPARLTKWVAQIGIELERIPTEAEAAAFVKARIAERPEPPPFPKADDVSQRIDAISRECADGVESGADYLALLREALADYIGELGDRWQTREIIIPAVGAAVDEVERMVAARRQIPGAVPATAAAMDKEFRLLLNARLKDARLRYRLNHDRGW